MDPVATGASSEGDDPIPDLRFLLDFIDRQQPRIAAVDQWVPKIAIIEIDRSVDGGNSHAISVIANACDDSVDNATWMQDAWRELFRRVIR